MLKYLCFLSLTVCFFSTAQDNIYQAILLDKNLTDNANAVVRLDEMAVFVEAVDKMRVRSKRVVTVLNKRGSIYVHAYLNYEKNYRIITLEAKVYNAYGVEVKKIKKKDFIDVSAVPGGTLYSDSRVLYLQYTPTSYPYTIEFIKEYISPNTAFLPTWNFLDGHAVSTEKSDFAVYFPNNIPYRYKEINFGDYPILKKNETNGLRYTATNLMSHGQEHLSPPFREFAPMVRVAMNDFYLEGVRGIASTWEEYGKWIYNSLLKGRGAINSATISKIQNLVKDVEDDKEKVNIVYNYVQENTRYISVQMGIGGWMPISANEVDRVKYGDCKGLTNYTKALLDVVGVESFYTVVYAGKRIRNIDPDFPSMQGNHAFLNIPIDGKDTWLECTSQIVPFGFLGDFTDNRDVFVVTPDGGKIVATPKYSTADNSQYIKGEYILLENGSIDVQVKITSKGIQYDSKFSIQDKEKRELDIYYKNYWSYIDNMSIREIAFENNKDSIVFDEMVSFQASDYISVAGEEILFTPNALNRNTYVPDRYRNRKLPLKIERGFVDVDEYEINIPKNYFIEFLPKDVEIENKFGEYKVRIEKLTDNVIKYNRTFIVSDGLYQKEDYSNYRSFIREVTKNDNAKIVLRKK